VKCTEEELSLLIEIRDLLAASRANAVVDSETSSLATAVSKTERALFLLERNVGDLEDAFIDIAEAFDELAKLAGLSNHVARRARGILERRRLR
jgi:hypothetical protein